MFFLVSLIPEATRPHQLVSVFVLNTSKKYWRCIALQLHRPWEEAFPRLLSWFKKHGNQMLQVSKAAFTPGQTLRRFVAGLCGGVEDGPLPATINVFCSLEEQITKSSFFSSPVFIFFFKYHFLHLLLSMCIKSFLDFVQIQYETHGIGAAANSQ